MSDSKRTILVFGATGQQGGSVAAALLAAGWQVRALVRDPAAPKSLALRAAGVETVPGDLADSASIRSAMRGVHGVFSVQPSAPGGTVTDDDEIRFGIAIADIALESGVAHLVYSSVNAVGDGNTGLSHFDTKARIEAHIRTLPLDATIIRPAAFMEMLMMPGFGLDERRFNFFIRDDQAMSLLAVEDIGKFVAVIFADQPRFAGTTLDLAGDAVTGSQLQALFTEAAGFPITYARFPDAVLDANPFLAKLTYMLDHAEPASAAELDTLRSMNPALQSLRTWLAGTGKAPFATALGTAGGWAYNANDK